MFIQSHNTYSWYHIRWIYTTPTSLEYHFLGVHRSNPFVSDLMAVSQRLPILVKKLLAEALKFWIFNWKDIREVSDFYINVQANPVGFLWDFKRTLREMNHINIKWKLVGLWSHIKIKYERYIFSYYRYIFHIYCEYLRNYYTAIASPLRCPGSNDGFSKTIIYVKNPLLHWLVYFFTFNFLLFVINW